MKRFIILTSILFIISCQSKNLTKMELNNEQVKNHSFLKDMYEDRYFPNKLVDKGVDILLNLCYQIETKKPKNLEGLYLLTHYSTKEFNNLQNEFYQNESEIETVARDCIAMDFEFIANAYGFNADTEELIAPREW